MGQPHLYPAGAAGKAGLMWGQQDAIGLRAWVGPWLGLSSPSKGSRQHQPLSSGTEPALHVTEPALHVAAGTKNRAEAVPSTLFPSVMPPDQDDTGQPNVGGEGIRR